MVIQGKPMMDFILLDLGAVECSPTRVYKEWLEDVMEGTNLKWLTLEDFYGAGHERGTFIWTPPLPAAANLVLV